MNLRPVHAVYAALTAGVLVSIISAFNVMSLLRSTADQASAQFRESIVWYATSFGAELNMLIDAVRDQQLGEAESTAELVDRFDVFWSRLESSGKGPLGRRYARLENTPETVADALAALREFEPVVLAEGKPDSVALLRFLASLRELRPRFRSLSLAAVNVRNAENVEFLRLQRTTSNQVLLLLAVVLALGTLLMMMLRREKAIESRLRRRLEKRVADRTLALEQSESRYRTLVDHAPEAIVVFDADLGHFVDVNKNATELFKMDRAELLQIGPARISPECQPDGRDSASAAQAYLRQAIEGGSTMFEWMHCDARGTEIPCEVRLVMLPSADATLVRGSITDISVRKDKDRELTRYRENLEELVQERSRELDATQQELLRAERLAAIGQLTGTVSHELRNPLATIGMCCQLLHDRLSDTNLAANTLVDRMLRNISRCDSIIEDLLDYTRAHVLNQRSVDIDAWLNTVLDELPVPESVTVVRTLEAGVTLRVDPDRLRQVIVNLMENAWQALLEGDNPVSAPEIRLSSSVSGKRLTIQVADNGPGVTPENRQNIFEPLFSTRAFGFGLGLPLVREIIERHGGDVELAADTQSGAEFTVSLPLE